MFLQVAQRESKKLTDFKFNTHNKNKANSTAIFE